MLRHACLPLVVLLEAAAAPVTLLGSPPLFLSRMAATLPGLLRSCPASSVSLIRATLPFLLPRAADALMLPSRPPVAQFVRVVAHSREPGAVSGWPQLAPLRLVLVAP